MKRIKKFNPLSVMKIAAICYAALGLFEGILVAVVFSVIGPRGPEATGMPRFLAPLFGVFSIFVFPIGFAVVGAIGGGLGAVIYNVAARFVGGIEVEAE
jgi:hypothetical protein